MDSALQLPHFESHEKAMRNCAIISILAHCLLFGAFSWAFPYQPPKAQDAGIDIDLAMVEPEPPQEGERLSGEDAAPAAPQEAPPQEVAESEPEPDAIPLPEEKPKPKPKPKPEPKKTPVPKQVAVKTSPAAPGAVASKGVTAHGGTNAFGGSGTKKNAAPVLKGSAGNLKPEYPELARKRNQEGTVRVRCQVDVQGKVASAEVAQSSGYKLLDDAALKTVRRWSFTPAQSDGQAVAGSVVVPVSFRLQ